MKCKLWRLDKIRMTLDITWGHSRLKYTQSMEEESRKFKDDRIVSVRSGELDQRWLHTFALHVAWFFVQTYLQGAVAFSYYIWSYICSVSLWPHNTTQKVIRLTNIPSNDKEKQKTLQ